MNRGDLVTVALSGDLGKPRPAVVVQSEDYPGPRTVLVCPLTTTLRDADAFRLTVAPSESNGLRAPSQVMLDKVTPAPRERCGPVIGRLDAAELAELTRRIVALLGAA